MSAPSIWTEFFTLFETMKTVAVVGASNNASKYGFTVYKRLKDCGYQVYPVNPNRAEVQGDKTYPSLADLPIKPDLVSVITPPSVSIEIVQQAIDLKLPRIWLQPGAENDAIETLLEKRPLWGVTKKCILVALTVWCGRRRAGNNS